jgi:SpoIID/LytB domain protein
MGRRWILATLVALLPCAAGARPFQGLSRRDQLALLYRPSFQFTPSGEPQVSIGLIAGAREATFRGAGGLRLLPAGEDGVELPVPAGEVVRIRVQSGEAARLRYWAAVRAKGGDAAERSASLDTWRGRGFSPKLFETGGVLGLGRDVLDNRAAIVGLESFTAREAAVRRAAEIALAHRSKIDVYEEMAALPSGVLEITGKDGAPRALVRDLVWLVAARGDSVEVEGRPYRGTLYVTFDAQGRLAVGNLLRVEEALLGVVPAELFPRAPLEALKAQAVSARGEVLAKIGTRHFNEPFRVCAVQHCQMYKGLSAEHPRTTAAVRTTRGQVLWADGGLVDTVYSASCGGHTEHNEVVWGTGADRHLRGRVDGGEPAGDLSDERALRRFLEREPSSYCARSRLTRKERFRWTRRFAQPEIATLVAAVRDVGAVRAVEVTGRGVSGRVTAVRVHGERGDLVVEREYPVRRLFGGLYSGMFLIEPEPASKGIPSGFVFRGGGWGHGVGMCQTGAMGMAESGHDFRKILRHYYRGGRVRALY